MVKGVAVQFKGYEETIPKMLELIKFGEELKKHGKIVLKPNIFENSEINKTRAEFVEPVLRFCMENKAPGAEVFIADGADGKDTMDVFEKEGYKKLAEKYGIGLVDLNKTELTEKQSDEFLRFDEIHYPKILEESFVISLPAFGKHEELQFSGALSNMIGAFPASKYKGFLSRRKNKLDGVPKKYQVHDILKCKMPNFSVADASENGKIYAGQPLEIDKQGTRLFGVDWKEVPYLRLVDESFNTPRIQKET